MSSSRVMRQRTARVIYDEDEYFDIATNLDDYGY